MTQNIFSRPNQFDGALTISTVEDVLGSKPDQFWLNVPVPLSFSRLSPSLFSSTCSLVFIFSKMDLVWFALCCSSMHSIANTKSVQQHLYKRQ